MTKFAFIYPGTNKDLTQIPPLNLLILASVLVKNGIETIIIDEPAGQNIEKELQCFKPDIVGITAFTFQFDDAIRAADTARKMGITTVMGGIHALSKPEDFLDKVDIVIQGEAEDIIVDIAEGKIKDKLVKCSIPDDLNNYPFPAWDLINMDFYARARKRFNYSILNFSPVENRVASMLTSRGCPYSCIFCHNSWKGSKFRCLTVENVLEQIKFLVKNYNINSICFLDDDLFFKQSRLKEICEGIISEKLNIVWACNARVTDVKDENLLRLAKKAGLRQIAFGFESGSQRILEVLNKKTTVEQASKAIKLCRKIGIEIVGNFLVGTPTETKEDIQKTIDFMKYHDLDTPSASIMTPLPGTQMWNWCQENGSIPEDFKWSDLNFFTVPCFKTNENMSPEEIYNYYLILQDIVDKKAYQRSVYSYLDGHAPILKKLKKAIHSPAITSKYVKKKIFSDYNLFSKNKL